MRRLILAVREIVQRRGRSGRQVLVLPREVAIRRAGFRVILAEWRICSVVVMRAAGCGGDAVPPAPTENPLRPPMVGAFDGSTGGAWPSPNSHITTARQSGFGTDRHLASVFWLLRWFLAVNRNQRESAAVHWPSCARHPVRGGRLIGTVSFRSWLRASRGSRSTQPKCVD